MCGSIVNLTKSILILIEICIINDHQQYWIMVLLMVSSPLFIIADSLCVIMMILWASYLYLRSNTHQKLPRILYCANMTNKWLFYDHQVQFKSIMSYSNEAHPTKYSKTHTKYSTERCNSPFHTAGHLNYSYSIISLLHIKRNITYISYVNIGLMISTVYQTWHRWTCIWKDNGNNTVE